MSECALQILTPSQLELLILLAFQHVPLSQKAVLALLGPHWQLPQLQQELDNLIKAGWVAPRSGRWGVPSELQERVARHAWRSQLLHKGVRPLPREQWTVRALTSGGSEWRNLIVRELRMALYAGDGDAFACRAEGTRWLSFATHPYEQFWHPFDPEWLNWLEPSIRTRLIDWRLLSTDTWGSAETAYLEATLLQSILSQDPEGRVNLAFQALLAGRLEVGERLVSQLDHPAALACLAFAKLQRGQVKQAAETYRRARADLRKLTGRRKVGFDGEYGWLELLALVELGEWSEAEKWLPTLPLLTQILQLARGQDQSHRLPPWRPGGGLTGLLEGLLYAWCDTGHQGWVAEVSALKKQGRDWLAAEYASLLGRKLESWQKQADEAHLKLGTRSLLQALTPSSPWQLALDAIEKLRPVRSPAAEPVHNHRLVWQVEVYRDGEALGIEPVEQKLTAKRWTGGRAVALKRLAQESQSMLHLTPADRGICRALRSQRSGYYGQVDISFDTAAAAPFLIGHPLVFRRTSGEPLVVKAVRPRLEIVQKNQDWQVCLQLPRAFCIRGQQLEILQFNACERGLQTILSKGLLVPPGGQSRLYGILRNLADQVVGDLPADPDQVLASELQQKLMG